jgi:hypothetical protein
MPEDEDVFDRALTALVTHVPGWAVAAICLLLYPGLGLLVPLALDWSTSNLISINVVGVMLAAVVSLGWLMVRIEAKDRRHLVEWTTNLRLLSAQEFEWLVGELYRREGWRVRETGRQDRADGNIDLELTRGRERRLVQCKRWTAQQVGVNDIRAFAGTLLREGTDGKGGDFVTLSTFNEHAQAEASQTGITLVDGRQLYQRIEAARRLEPCPECGKPMILDRSLRGWWFRCVASGCQGKRDLAAEPARAVELLTHGPALSAGPGVRD